MLAINCQKTYRPLNIEVPIYKLNFDKSNFLIDYVYYAYTFLLIYIN